MSLINDRRREFVIVAAYLPASPGQLMQETSTHVYYVNAKDAVLEAVDLMDHDGRIVFAEVFDGTRSVARLDTPWREADHTEIRNQFPHPDRAKRVPTDSTVDIVPRRRWLPSNARCEKYAVQHRDTCGNPATLLVETAGKTLTGQDVRVQRFRCVSCYNPKEETRIAQV